jgi:hypothetical protein
MTLMPTFICHVLLTLSCVFGLQRDNILLHAFIMVHICECSNSRRIAFRQRMFIFNAHLLEITCCHVAIIINILSHALIRVFICDCNYLYFSISEAFLQQLVPATQHCKNCNNKLTSYWPSCSNYAT